MAMVVPEKRKLAIRFAEYGFVSPLRIHDAAEVDRVRQQFDALEAAEGREKCQIGLLDRHFDQRFVWNLATDPAILDAVEAILGPDVMLLATHFFCKYPADTAVLGARCSVLGEDDRSSRAERQAGAVAEHRAPSTEHGSAAPPERFVAWHQDVTYWGLEPPVAITAWYAVDDSDAENGCMRVIPGTHHGIREHGTSERAGNLLSINQEVPVTDAEEASAVDLPLSAGEVSLHHGMLIHGSNPNRSSRRRCGLTIRYTVPKVRHVVENSLRRPWRAILLRGEDRFHHFGEIEPPYAN
jgi:hypothetical protein